MSQEKKTKKLKRKRSIMLQNIGSLAQHLKQDVGGRYLQNCRVLAKVSKTSLAIQTPGKERAEQRVCRLWKGEHFEFLPDI